MVNRFERVPLSLYIHWPWCLRKCPYCDFNSHAKRREDIPEKEFLADLKRAFLLQKPLFEGRRIETVFWGGGTPSLMAPSSIAEFLEFVAKESSLAEDAEITLEANPGSVERGSFAALRSAGVNRISLGIQSFQDEKLKALGRIHNGGDAKRAAEEVAEHFDNFNIDLMFALPGQSYEDLMSDMRCALDVGSTHLSYYQLTIEEQTAFAKRPPEGLPEDETIGDMLDFIETETEKAGFSHYEVSAYAKDGKRCRHNLNYWEFGDYIGIGPGAHGKLSTEKGVLRTASFCNPGKWMRDIEEAGTGFEETRIVTEEEMPFEFMLNALRLRSGADPRLWEERTFLPWTSVKARWDEGVAEGLLTDPAKRLCTTEKGWRFLNEAQELFL